MKRAWGFDVSKWDVRSQSGSLSIIDYAPLIQLQPSFVFVKSSESTFLDPRHAEHIAAVQEAGLVLGLYHFFWATVPVQSQLDTFSALIDKFDPPIIIVDNEQGFINKELKKMFEDKKIPLEQAAIRSDVINSQSREFLNRLRQLYPEKLLLHYTADWFVNSFCMQMSHWINEFPLWLAAYPYEKGNSPRVVADWDEFELLREELTEEMIQDRMPPKAEQWLFWQWGADKLFLPEPYPKNFHVDINVFNGTPEEFHARFGGQPGGTAASAEQIVEVQSGDQEAAAP